MPTPPPVIPSLPTPAPSSTDIANFDSRSDAYHAVAPSMVDGMNAAAENVFSNASEVAAIAAAVAEVAEQTFQTANAAMHNPATAYGTGQNAISAIDYQTYRRKAPGGVDAADPAGSSLWEIVRPMKSDVLRNLARNGGFNVLSQSSAFTVTPANQHFNEKLFGWRAGASGLSWSSAVIASTSYQLVTISAGSLVQNIWGEHLPIGTLYLTWVGTAQGRINGGAWGASGLSVAYVGGNLSIEFSSGTLSYVQLSEGSPSLFQRRSLAEEEAMFQPYFWTSNGGVRPTTSGWGINAIAGASMVRRSGAETVSNFDGRFPSKMAIVPTITWYSPGTGTSGNIRNVTASADVAVTGTGTAGPSQFSTGGVSHASNGAAGNVIAAHWVADARI
jgi:hypothetical protein